MHLGPCPAPGPRPAWLGPAPPFGGLDAYAQDKQRIKVSSTRGLECIPTHCHQSIPNVETRFILVEIRTFPQLMVCEGKCSSEVIRLYELHPTPVQCQTPQHLPLLISNLMVTNHLAKKRTVN